jgi:hypothetical protein
MIKKLLLAAGALCLIGCHGGRIGAARHSDETEYVGGVWAGAATIGGRPQTVSLELIQHDRAIGIGQGGATDPSTLDVDYGGTLHARLTGTVSGAAVSLVGDEGSACLNKLTVSGEVSGALLIVTLSGAGNAIPGTTCYPAPLSVTVSLHR